MRKFFTTLCTIPLLSSPLFAGEADRTITVTGQGKVSAPPDTAFINTGVETESPTAAEALSANNTAMNKIMDVLKKHHIADKDIQTSGFNVSPVYRRDNRNRTVQEITGYRVTNQVRVEVRNLPDLGDVLDALVQAGSNRISGIGFSVADPTGLLNEARSKAIADARSRAGVYAQAAGVEVGKVRTISEQNASIPRPLQRGNFLAAEAARSVPVASGELDFTVSVHVVYDLQ